MSKEYYHDGDGVIRKVPGSRSQGNFSGGVFGFAAFLSAREGTLKSGRQHRCAILAELAGEYLGENYPAPEYPNDNRQPPAEYPDESGRSTD